MRGEIQTTGACGSIGPPPPRDSGREAELRLAATGRTHPDLLVSSQARVAWPFAFAFATGHVRAIWWLSLPSAASMLPSSLSMVRATREQASWELDLDGGGGCFARHTKRQRLISAGPADARSFLEYPKWLWGDLSQEDQQRIVSHFRVGGVTVYGHFSGLDMYLLKMHDMLAMARHDAPDIPHASPIRNLHACDIDHASRRLLANLPPQMAPDHIHGDMLDRLPEDVLLRLTTLHEKYSMKFKVQEAQAEDPAASKQESASFRFAEAQQMVRALCDVLAQVDFGSLSSYCVVHNKCCPTFGGTSSFGELRVATGSSICCDFSSYGSGVGILGKSVLPFLMWVMERKQMQEDLIFHENVPRWEREALWIVQEHLVATHVLECVTLSPDQMGVPMTRARCFLIARKRATIECLHPITNEQFEKFRHSVVMTADNLFMAPPDVVMRKESALRKDLQLPPGEALEARHWLGAHTSRVLDHLHADLAKVSSSSQPGDATGLELFPMQCRVVNATQSEKMARPSSMLGSLQRNSLHFSFRLGRTLLPMEAISCMGLDIWPHLSGSCPSPVLGAIRRARLRDRELRSLAGNTIHGVCLYAVLLVAFSTSRRRCGGPAAPAPPCVQESQSVLESTAPIGNDSRAPNGTSDDSGAIFAAYLVREAHGTAAK